MSHDQPPERRIDKVRSCQPTLRVLFPAANRRGGTRVFEVEDDGSETELHEVVRVTVHSVPDDVVRVYVTKFLTEPHEVTGLGRVVVICPECRKEQRDAQG